MSLFLLLYPSGACQFRMSSNLCTPCNKGTLLWRKRKWTTLCQQISIKLAKSKSLTKSQPTMTILSANVGSLPLWSVLFPHLIQNRWTWSIGQLCQTQSYLALVCEHLWNLVSWTELWSCLYLLNFWLSSWLELNQSDFALLNGTVLHSPRS